MIRFLVSGFVFTLALFVVLLFATGEVRWPL